MSDMAAVPGPANPAEADVQVVRAAQLDAARVNAQKAAGATSAAEAKDFADASFKLAQAVVVLDPTLDQQGIPIAQQERLERVRQDGQEKLEKARQASAAPAPGKRRLSIKRDTAGRMSGAEVEG